MIMSYRTKSNQNSEKCVSKAQQCHIRVIVENYSTFYISINKLFIKQDVGIWLHTHYTRLCLCHDHTPHYTSILHYTSTPHHTSILNYTSTPHHTSILHYTSTPHHTTPHPHYHATPHPHYHATPHPHYHATPPPNPRYTRSLKPLNQS